MSKIEIDFNTLKYNLYEILNVSPDAEDIKIKKQFMKIIKNFHPDKNSELEEDIYYHIILANQILLNKESRRKYDMYTMDKADTFNELKTSFNKTMKDVEKLFPEKNVSISSYKSKMEELNKKHGYNDNTNNTMEKFASVKKNRNITIDYEEIKSTDEFNNKFDSNKINNSKFKDMIVEYKGAPMELSTYVIGEQYSNLMDIDKLYVEDSIDCPKFSSLDRAFTLQPVMTNEIKLSNEQRIKEYRDMTESIKNMKI